MHSIFVMITFLDCIFHVIIIVTNGLINKIRYNINSFNILLYYLHFREDLLRRLNIVVDCMNGAGAVLPMWDGDHQTM